MITSRDIHVHTGGHNYTGWCGDQPCPVNSKQGVGATVAAALNDGGIDYNCGPLYKTQLYNALVLGSVTEEDIDRAAARIYHTQIRLGMLDPPDSQQYRLALRQALDTHTHTHTQREREREREGKHTHTFTITRGTVTSILQRSGSSLEELIQDLTGV